MQVSNRSAHRGGPEASLAGDLGRTTDHLDEL